MARGEAALINAPSLAHPRALAGDDLQIVGLEIN
jgi:hypothetical protein